MAGYSYTCVVGNLGQDPEVRFTQNGKPVCNFSVAVNTEWKDNSGEKQKHTQWFNVVVWGNQAEPCGKYLAKGREVMVIGEMRSRKWTDKNNVERVSWELIANRVQFLGGGQGSGRPAEDDPPAMDPEDY